MRPYNSLVHPRGWRAFMEYGNGIMGDMCIHMLDMTRWMLELGWPKRISSTGGILVDKASKANIPDTQTATFDFGDLNVVWQHRTWGDPPDPKYPWGATFYGDKGTLKASVMGYDFIPHGERPADPQGCRPTNWSNIPKTRPRRIWKSTCAPAIRGHMKDFLVRSRPEAGRWPTSRRAISRRELHPGQPVDETRPHLAWDRKQGRVVGDDEANRL